MNFIEKTEKLKKQLNLEFPIVSQTTDEDKIVLLKLKNLMQKLNSYSYLEIGTYLGGSLTPFVKDSNCKYILSIDDRERAQHEETLIDLDLRNKEFARGRVDFPTRRTHDGA